MTLLSVWEADLDIFLVNQDGILDRIYRRGCDKPRTFCHFPNLRPNKKLVLFPEIGRVKNFLSLTRPHSQMCLNIYAFNLKKQKLEEDKK